MLNFLRIMRDPDPEPGFGEAIIEALDKQEVETPETPAAPETPATPETPEAPKEWDKVERRKGYEGEKRRAADKTIEDPEHEVDFELEAGKGKAKIKLSELKDTAKWIHENRGTLQSMLKHRQMAAKYPEFGKVMDAVINKSFDGDKFNGEFVNKTLATLEGKAEKLKKKLRTKMTRLKKCRNNWRTWIRIVLKRRY